MSSSLSGKSIVITRSISQNESLRRLLEARDANVIEVPLIAIEEPEDDGRERDEVLQRLHEFDWLVVTSPNGAERVAPFLAAAQAAGDLVTLPTIAAVGDATARSLNCTVSLVAQPSRAEILAEMFPVGSGTVLLVQGNLADSLLTDALSEKGWQVEHVVAYRTVQLRPDENSVENALHADALFLASGSAASAWFDVFGVSAPPVIVAIGPSTAKVAENVGLDVTAISPDHTLESMIETAERVFLTHQH